MIKICSNCRIEKDLDVWYGHIKGYICNDCAASLYHQEHCYNKKEIQQLKDKLHRRNMQIKDLKRQLEGMTKHACGDCVYYGDCKGDVKTCEYADFNR